MKKKLTEKQLFSLEIGRKKAHENAKNRKPFLGKIHSEKTKKKISKSVKKNPTKYWLGKNHSEETKKKISETKKKQKIITPTTFKKGQKAWNKGLIKENSHAWKGGKSFEPYSIEWTKELKEKIRKRDKYKCQLCNKKEKDLIIKNRNGKIVPLNLCVHHIDYNKQNCNKNNLITLCRKCNVLVNYERNKWKKFFKEKLQ